MLKAETSLPDLELISRICDFVDSRGGGDTPCLTDIPGLVVLCRRAPSTLESAIYNPSLCLILQGQKETHQGGRRLRLAAGDSVVVSHHLPIVARIREASAERPYVALVLDLDLSIVRSLCDEVGEIEIEQERSRSLAVGGRDGALLQAMERLFALVDRPLESRVLAPLIQREIHFRLLLAPHGGMLRQLVRRRSHASRITQAIAHLRQDAARSVSVAELARVAGMSPSSFHEHFKSVTGTTPVQYQKEMRLLEARQSLLDGTHSVSEAAYDVGYESPTQFSREYSRRFGHPPRRDLRRSTSR